MSHKTPHVRMFLAELWEVASYTMNGERQWGLMNFMLSYFFELKANELQIRDDGAAIPSGDNM